MEVRRGELVAVVGQVGAGKSSLLAALIGDMERVGGACRVNVQAGSVVQQPESPSPRPMIPVPAVE